jgi:hypothetical protein
LLAFSAAFWRGACVVWGLHATLFALDEAYSGDFGMIYDEFVGG